MLRKYVYNYDQLNRLRNAIYQKPESPNPVSGSYNESLNYDKNGNILHLDRYGSQDSDSNTIPTIKMDDLNYVYAANSNQLQNVSDATNSPLGFKDGINTSLDYSYDDNGNMIVDNNKGITAIVYNHLNLPNKISFANGGIITYFYNAMGQKVKKVVLENAVTTTTDYLTGYQYKNGSLQFFPTAEGYVNYTEPTIKGGLGNFNYAYNYKDHLGNVRLTYAQDPVTLALRIMEENHYYPFGLKHSGYNSDQLMYIKQGTTTKIVPIPPLFKTSYAYKFNSRELQEELGLNMYDLGARGYMPDTGRLTTIDPKSEKYAFQSPFAIAVNNPVFFVDINGEGVDTDYTVLTNGEVKRADPKDGSEKNEKDRILKSDGKGNVDNKEVKNADGTTTKTPKVAVDNIAKGIVKEGTNFKNESQIIKIGGEGQPSAKDVQEFLVQFSENIANVEISGFGGSMVGSSQNVMMTEAYKNNSLYESQSEVLGYLDVKNTTQGSLFVEYHFHLHPDASSLMTDDINIPSEPDSKGRVQRNEINGILPHYIYNKNGVFKY